ncbi:MAG TPA: hypothetical protein VFL47_16025 [Flavisolibacter sp.]|nr:hypothetical protein [Flavisolibacter sp.]
MRTISRLTLLVITATLLSLTTRNASSRPSSITVNSIEPIAIDVLVPCADNGNGEWVHLEGNLHVLVTFTAKGTRISGIEHFQPQGLSGTGLTTGDKYQATGVTQEFFQGSLQNGQFSYTFINNFRIIGTGPGNNYLVHENAHVTLNANGDITVDHDNFSVDCR